MVTNSPRESESPTACAEEIGELAKTVGKFMDGKETVIISSLIFRSDIILGKQINEVNSALSKLCCQHNWTLIRHHTYITHKHLNRSCLYLNIDGTTP